MDDAKFDRLIVRLGQLNEQLRQLEDVDYITASYKGFSASGATLADVQADIATTQQKIMLIQEQLAHYDS
ncbi:hypothetical protein FC83_GL002599 [Agrilactobacillus composti DSM 18527 = JCM 14202]|uniref:Uncharacterized protein n=1 Tax=Agrilactobacillus composti DSM 18527 = JCM 14202 TaxID=1423734 RepID=X0QSL5_9LACO|nr:hypothetical protein [Agrilactobacillus composti]KRM36724.1 hypothetical protein FC83_GL002599 [Agrilactobacillus composti DSM 18527 = JCM 14202]GAF41595.1 hypothetical protein JCM14202_3546 [Agrilactobacillus composti DSM 18527 = JCM 14202]